MAFGRARGRDGRTAALVGWRSPAGDLLEAVCGWRSGRARVLARAGVATLAGISAIVSLVSIAVGYEQYWNAWTHVSPPAHAARRAHSYYWSLAHRPVAGSIHLIRTGHALAPIHFRHGADAIGVTALILAAVAAVVP